AGAQRGMAVVEGAGAGVGCARLDAVDEVVLTVVNLTGYGAVGHRRRARRVRADVIALNDFAGARRTAAVFDQDAVVDIAGDYVARRRVCTADLVAVGALEIDARVVADRRRARCVRADEVAFDVSVGGGALEQSDAVVKAVDDQAPHRTAACGDTESAATADAVAVQFDKQDGVVALSQRVRTCARLRVAIDGYWRSDVRQRSDDRCNRADMSSRIAIRIGRGKFET